MDSWIYMVYYGLSTSPTNPTKLPQWTVPSHVASFARTSMVNGMAIQSRKAAVQ